MVFIEERLKIKVSDDFSQSQERISIKPIKLAYMYLGLADGVIF